MELLQKLKNRYATKIFDKNKKVSQEDLNSILEAFRLSTSSFWLQPWKIILVENKDLRKELLPFSWNQTQIIDASHLLVLCRKNNLWNDFIEEYLQDLSQTRWLKREEIEGYEKMMKGFILSKNKEELDMWASKQVNIALWSLIVYIASKDIDACPMEGFDSQKYDEILWLKELNLSSTLVLPIWYRSIDDKYASLEKVRFSLDKILITK